MLSPYLFNFCVEPIVWNAGLDESQAGVKITRRNINRLRYTDDISLMVESEEELKSLLMRWKKRVTKLAWNSALIKWRSWIWSHLLVPNRRGKSGEWQIFFSSTSIWPWTVTPGMKFKRCLLHGRKAIANLNSIFKKLRISWLIKVHIVKTMFFQ